MSEYLKKETRTKNLVFLIDGRHLFLDNNEKITQLQKLINDSKRIVFFGGAGVSVPSGIPDFRSAGGIFNQAGHKTYSPEEIVSHTFFMRNPQAFYKFYKDKMIYPSAKPNIVHGYLKSLEDKHKDVTIITQNIDGLHSDAGSKKVLELHGSIKNNYCIVCHKKYLLESLDLSRVPYCSCGGIIKPDVILYEEPLDSSVLEKAIEALEEADLLIIGGTSLKVYPAAGLIRYYKGDDIVVVNLQDNQVQQASHKKVLYVNADIADVFNCLK